MVAKLKLIAVLFDTVLVVMESERVVVPVMVVCTAAVLAAVVVLVVAPQIFHPLYEESAPMVSHSKTPGMRPMGGGFFAEYCIFSIII